MRENKELIDKLRMYTSFNGKEVIHKIYMIRDMSFVKLRDSLIGMGQILEEDFEKQVYVIAIRSVTANMNTAVVAIQLMDDNTVSFLGYAKEGLIKQHTAEKAILKIMDQIKPTTDREVQ